MNMFSSAPKYREKERNEQTQDGMNSITETEFCMSRPFSPGKELIQKMDTFEQELKLLWDGGLKSSPLRKEYENIGGTST